MPVISMSMRFRIGMVQLLARPGSGVSRPFPNDASVGHAGAPLVAGFEHDGGVEHVRRRRVGGCFGAADVAEDLFNLRNARMILSCSCMSCSPG